MREPDSDYSTGRYRAELTAALKREETLSEVLSLINTSRDDERPVFDVILENAVRLCGADRAAFLVVNEEQTHLQFKQAYGTKAISVRAESGGHWTIPLCQPALSMTARLINRSNYHEKAI